MGLIRKTYTSREDWLEHRAEIRGIGGSEAAAALGLSPWQTPLELWRLKIGAVEPKDLSGNAAVEQGVRMEPILRDFFTATHPEYEVTYHPYDILYQTGRKWLFATLDGELDRADGRHGILEIKTATPKGREGWAEWADGHLPQHYFIQTLHQLLATGYDFVILYAALFSLDGSITLKPPYEIERNEHEGDLKWLLEQEEAFYKHVENGTMPPQPLIL